MIPNAGRGGVVTGPQPTSTWSPNKLWRSNSILAYDYNYILPGFSCASGGPGPRHVHVLLASSRRIHHSTEVCLGGALKNVPSNSIWLGIYSASFYSCCWNTLFTSTFYIQSFLKKYSTVHKCVPGFNTHDLLHLLMVYLFCSWLL
jgi:hypothetical protein